MIKYCNFVKQNGRMECLDCGQTHPYREGIIVAECNKYRSRASGNSVYATLGYGELAAKIQNILRERLQLTLEQLTGLLDNCPRVPGVVSGMVAAGKLKIDGEKLTGKTVVSILGE